MGLLKSPSNFHQQQQDVSRLLPKEKNNLYAGGKLLANFCEINWERFLEIIRGIQEPWNKLFPGFLADFTRKILRDHHDMRVTVIMIITKNYRGKWTEKTVSSAFPKKSFSAWMDNKDFEEWEPVVFRACKIHWDCEC